MSDLRDALDELLNACAGAPTMFEVLAEDRKDGPVADLARRQSSKLRNAVTHGETALDEWWAEWAEQNTKREDDE